MAKDFKIMTSEEVYAEPVNNVAELSIAANQIAAGSGENPYELRNTRILEQKKAKIRYLNGYTIAASAQALFNDAQRKARHSRILGNNIQRANPHDNRPHGVDAHHIVAQLNPGARLARTYLFNWGIAINDADNGVYLPRYAHTQVSSMPNAAKHQKIHTLTYYLAVTTRLMEVEDNGALDGRATLRTIKSELIAGVFPF